MAHDFCSIRTRRGNISLTRFWGGKGYGLSVQVTFFLYDGVVVHCGEWDTYKFIFYTGMPSYVPSHWMPLPEPPEATV